MSPSRVRLGTRVTRVRAGVALGLLATAYGVAPLAAQSPAPRSPAAQDSAAAAALGPTTVQTVPAEYGTELPADSLADLLRLQPGIGTDAAGSLTVRGQGDALATYVDGIPVTPGFRGAAAALRGSSGSRLRIATNAFARASVVTGLAPAALGNGAGILALTTRGATDRWTGALGYESDGLLGGASIGLTRLRGSFSGPLGRNLRFVAAGIADGRRSMPTGFGAADAPIFVDAGQDTLLTAPDGSQTSVRRFAVGRGRCDAFAGSANAQIAANYGMSCSETRTPASSGSDYQVLGKLEYAAGGTTLSLLALASQDQARTFDYLGLYNPDDQWGERRASDLLGLTLGQRVGTGLWRAYLSHQRDRATRSPFPGFGPGAGTLGLFLKPYDFSYGLDAIPVDEQLIHDYRLNVPHSRRGPVDFEDQDQVDAMIPRNAIRNNAYAVNQFSESGGPMGQLALVRESRTLGGTSLELPTGQAGRLLLGAELTRFDLTNYSSGTASQAFSDVYLEKPVSGALYAEQTTRRGALTLALGARYDFYDSRASRAYFVCTEAYAFGGSCGGVLDVGDTTRSMRIFTNPQVDASREDLGILRRDARHGALSPRARLGYALSPTTEVRVTYGQQAQMPDLGLVLARINTDINLTSSTDVFGSDLDLIRVRTAELGLRTALGTSTTVDAAVYSRKIQGDVVARLVSLYDPMRATKNDFRIYTNVDQPGDWGLDLRADQRFGRVALASVAYSFQNGTRTVDIEGFAGSFDAARPDARPHSLAATIGLLAPNGRGADGLFATLRVASGAAYLPCAGDGNEGVLSGEACVRGGLGSSESVRLPAYKRLDLRLSKAVPLGATQLTLYVDARNALNWRNVMRVFAQTGGTDNPALAHVQYANDSTGYAVQARQNGVYGADGSIDLTFGGARASGCGGFVSANGSTPAVADCVYLVRAEQRFGNGDGVFSLAEQQAASAAFYQAMLGEQVFTDTPRQFRIGARIGF